MKVLCLQMFSGVCFVHLAPSVVILQGVDGQRQHLNAPPAELAAHPGGAPQLRGAHRREVSGVREQDSPSRGERQHGQSETAFDFAQFPLRRKCGHISAPRLKLRHEVTLASESNMTGCDPVCP